MQSALLLSALLSSQTAIDAFQTASTSRRAASLTSSHRRDGVTHQSHVGSPSIMAPARPYLGGRLRMSDDGNDNDGDPSSSSNVKLFELDDAFEDDGENVVGTKFFGGGAVKDELYVAEDEERASELQNAKGEDTEYRRFEDGNAFGDALASRVGEALQAAINGILNDGESGSGGASWREDPALKWDTPFPTKTDSPLAELRASNSFYNRLDVAILAAETTKSEGPTSVVEVRWDIGAVWPAFWESRVLLTGTSTLTVREENGSIVLLKQVDELDGSNPRDVVGSLSSQLPPRFWDVYHIGMTPSAELDPRFDNPLASSTSLSKNNNGNKGFLSGYKLSYLPPRLVTEPSLVDTNGREGRTAQALPNHGFTTAIKTMGPNKETFTPVSPIEVSISKMEGGEGSLVKWSVPVPPEFASKAVLPLPITDDDEDEEGEGGEVSAITKAKDEAAARLSPYTPGRTGRAAPEPPSSLSCSYSLRPNRLVATLPYAGNPQDEEVTQLRRKLYHEVVERDGYTPKLDPDTGRPTFFFWMNDAKACFTREGGLGMAIYEWRADWSKSNEVGIELEC